MQKMSQPGDDSIFASGAWSTKKWRIRYRILIDRQVAGGRLSVAEEVGNAWLPRDRRQVLYRSVSQTRTSRGKCGGVRHPVAVAEYLMEGGGQES